MERVKTFDGIVDEWYDNAPMIDTDTDSDEVFNYSV